MISEADNMSKLEIKSSNGSSTRITISEKINFENMNVARLRKKEIITIILHKDFALPTIIVSLTNFKTTYI
ncbi:MAG: hypothetical protein DRJ64_04855 [Thermoprotei archaeon]|nr:MAG: hypothetical protein DRJ64_04855 [Thermoprotei archaeon]